MKKRKNYSIEYHCIRWLCSIALLLAFGGCNSEESLSEQPDEGRLIPIEVSVSSMGGWQTESSAQSRTPSDTLSAFQIEEQSGVLTGTAAMGVQQASDETVSTREPIGINVHFRIVAYQCATAAAITTSNYVGYGDYKITGHWGEAVSGTKKLALQEGQYTFVCYTYSNNEVLPVFDSNTLSIPVGQGKDFMTCIEEGVQVVASYGANYRLDNLNFSRRCARLAIRVVADASRMAAITACSATMKLTSSEAIYSFTNNTVATNGNAYSMPVIWTAPNGTDIQSNFVYVLPQTATDIALSLDATIGGKTFTDIRATISGQSLAQQHYYLCKVELKTLDFILGGAVWARGNLRYVNGIYQFYPNTGDYSYATNGGDYWAWNAILPKPEPPSKAATWNDENDPCKQVEPKNTWHVPTADEGVKLAGGALLTGNGFTFDGIMYLPMAGHNSPGGMVENNTRGLYWVNRGSDIIFFGFIPDGACHPIWGGADRALGMAIRCVR